MKQNLLFIFSAILFCYCQQSFGKTLNNFLPADPISGTVVSKNGEPVIGATVYLKGTTIGTYTDVDGRFSLPITETNNYTIVITYIGYKPYEKEITTNESALEPIVLQEDALNLSEVIVTGYTTPKKKLESSVAITTMNSKRIEELAPQSAADLLQSVPGFVVETSGGEVGNNLFARGIPSAGAYEYVQIQEDGLPVFEDGALQFANADNWLRIDETVNRVEALRGGSGSIYATNAPGGIINFISKTGSNNSGGTAKLTGGTSGLFRTDLNVGGAIVPDKLFYNVGGFYRVDNGIRNPGFKANNGGQLKANIKYVFDQGSATLYYKKLDDRNLFLLPIPLTDKDDPKGIDGFDPNYGTLTSRNFSQLQVPQYGGGYFSRNLENGIHPNVDAFGGQVRRDLGSGFAVNDYFRYTNINLNYTAIFPGAEPQTAADFATNYTTTGGASFPVATPGYFYANSGLAANPALVAKVGYWAIDKQMNNFANNLRFDYSNQMFDISLGYYYSNWTSDQYWNWSNLLIEVTDNPQLLNLVDLSLTPGDTNYSRTYNGVSDISWLTRKAETKGDVNALFASAEIRATSDLTFDIGLRYDIDRYKGYKANSQFFSQNLDSSSFNYDFTTTTADNSITTTEMPFLYWAYDVNRLSFSGAANYKFTENMAAYIRYSNGFRSPIEEAYFDNAENLDKLKPTVINQVELGFKYQANNFAVFANAFYMILDNIAFTDILANGQSENKFAKAQNIGLEAEAEFNFGDFSLSLSGTLQDPTFKDFAGSGFDFNTNKVRRIPSVYGLLRPSYNITKDLMVYVEGNYFGKKYSDNANQFALPAFFVLDAGVALTVKQVRFAIDGTNLTNTIGLTEGNPRITTAPGSIYYARPILGTFAKASITVNF
ncbi:MAG: TonB-dependent receptor [Chitinophagales bacterium]|nr:TonB-dependent receptor [Chitinophagales bacterium]